MKQNSIKQLLMSSNYFVLNKQLVKRLGIETAFLFSVLVEADSTLADEEGWFYQTGDTIEELTGLSRYKQDASIKKLSNLGILIQKNMGVPCKRYFKIDYDIFEKFLFSDDFKTSFQKNKKLDSKEIETQFSKNLKTSSQNSLKNKEININKLDKEISSSADETTQQQLDEKSIEFRKNITELKNIIINSTGENPVTVDMVFKPVIYSKIIIQLLEKIKASKFLMGQKETKPKLHTFIRQDRINEILAGFYDDYKKEKNIIVTTEQDLKNQAKREKEQKEFEKILGL